MLYYDRIDISEGIDLAKSNKSKECLICHYWFYDHGLKFQDSLRENCPNTEFFSGPYFPSFGQNM